MRKYQCCIYNAGYAIVTTFANKNACADNVIIYHVINRFVSPRDYDYI